MRESFNLFFSVTAKTSARSFHVSEVMFQFPITSLRQDCHLRVSFTSLRVEVLCNDPIPLPRCVMGATWVIH